MAEDGGQKIMGKILKRDPKKYKCGKGMRTLRSFTVKGKSVDRIMRAMRDTSLSARETARSADILEKAIRDPECKIVLTLSGIVTVAKMGGIVCEMIEDGWVDCIVATGALIAHGIVEGRGGAHFEYDPSIPDEELYEQGYDRIYDTLELEANLDDLETELEEIWDTLFGRPEKFGSADFCYETGKMLHRKYPRYESIIKSAYIKKIPVIIPAFTDSELALEATSHALKKEIEKGKPFESALKSVETLGFNPFKDIVRYLEFVNTSKKLAVFTLGGGVPRNYAQQVMPLIEILGNRFEKYGLKTELPLKKFKYGVRICPEPVTLGGLSGCTYSEGVSWGKFFSPAEGGEFAEVYADYTAVLPWLVKSLQERLGG